MKYKQLMNSGKKTLDGSPLDFSVMKLYEKEEATIKSKPDEETGITLIQGTIICSLEKEQVTLSRKSVFQQKASAVYLCPADSVHFIAKEETELVICRSKAQNAHKSAIIREQDMHIRKVGERSYEREVSDIFASGENSVTLNIGETYQEGGNWSSIYPSEDSNYFFNGEEMTDPEVYYYKFFPEEGFGIQWLYSPKNDIDTAIPLRNNDAVITPLGHHPVVCAPKYKMYYLWFY